MRCPICKGTGKAASTAADGLPPTDAGSGSDCFACKGTGDCAIVPEATAGMRPEEVEALCAEELLQSERRSLILLLDYNLTFAQETTARWRDALQMIDLLGPDSGAGYLAEIRASFESEKQRLDSALSDMNEADKRAFERECREIERALIVLNALVEHAAACLRDHPEMRRQDKASP